MERLHPDIFTAPEAAAYLHLENVATLDWMRDEGHLTGHKIGKAFMYWRDDLDAAAKSVFGRNEAAKGKAEGRAALRLAGGRA